MNGGDVVGTMFTLLFVGALAFIIFSVVRTTRKARERGEALFKSMFPDLQPYFHPTKLIEYVWARRAQNTELHGPRTWASPPGFGEAASADIDVVKDRERVRLKDAAGAVLTEFSYDNHAEGGVIRVGKGKFTVNIVERERRVRYWHPDREFKWKNGAWTFESRMSESSIESSSDSSSSFSDRSSSSSSTSTAATAAAATAGIVAAGGAFDGGGASQSWVAGRDDDSSSSSSSSGLVATAY